jgi:uncharacterized membrane protein YedE/YeeE
MLQALIGGSLIGIAVSLMLLFNGRVAGISGILSGLLQLKNGETGWRMLFLLGLIVGGFFLKFFYPTAFVSYSKHMKPMDYILSGFLVGFGTLLANGCTSGHGVCGISRLSVRSILATIIFMIFGMLSVYLFKIYKGEL